MDVFLKFFVDFLATFFGSLWSAISGLFSGFFGMFNVAKYARVFKQYCGDFGGLAWILAILTVILVIVSALALTYVFVNGLEQSVLAYMVYILAFYTLVAASVFLAVKAPSACWRS